MRKLAWFLLISNVFLSAFVVFCALVEHDQILYMQRQLGVLEHYCNGDN